MKKISILLLAIFTLTACTKDKIKVDRVINTYDSSSYCFEFGGKVYSLLESASNLEVDNVKFTEFDGSEAPALEVGINDTWMLAHKNDETLDIAIANTENRLLDKPSLGIISGIKIDKDSKLNRIKLLGISLGDSVKKVESILGERVKYSYGLGQLNIVRQTTKGQIQTTITFDKKGKVKIIKSIWKPD